MAATTYKGKSLECLKFSGKDEEYQIWITKFEAYTRVKGFYNVMAGTEVPPLVSQTPKSTEEQKAEEKNDTGYCTMLLAMDSAGKAFMMVALAKTMELPAGCLKKAYDDIKKTYAPNTSTMVVTLIVVKFCRLSLLI